MLPFTINVQPYFTSIKRKSKFNNLAQAINIPFIPLKERRPQCYTNFMVLFIVLLLNPVIQLQTCTFDIHLKTFEWEFNATSCTI